MKRKLVSIVFLVLFSFTLCASGLGFLSNGPKEDGLGSTFTAIASDPTALIYNPAGLGFQASSISIFYGGSSALSRNVELDYSFTAGSSHWHDNQSDLFSDDPMEFFPYYNLPSGVMSVSFLNRLAVAVGAYRNVAYYFKINIYDEIGSIPFYETSAQMDNKVLHGGISLGILDNLSVGAGYLRNYNYFNYSLMNPEYGYKENGMNSTSDTYNAGILYKPTDWLNIGVSGTDKTAVLPAHISGALAFSVGGNEENAFNKSYLNVGCDWVGYSKMQFLAKGQERMMGTSSESGSDNSSSVWKDTYNYCISYLLQDEGEDGDFLTPGSFMFSAFWNASAINSEYRNPAYPDYGSEFGWTLGYGNRFSSVVTYYISTKWSYGGDVVENSGHNVPGRYSVINGAFNLGFTFRIGKEAD